MALAVLFEKLNHLTGEGCRSLAQTLDHRLCSHGNMPVVVIEKRHDVNSKWNCVITETCKHLHGSSHHEDQQKKGWFYHVVPTARRNLSHQNRGAPTTSVLPTLGSEFDVA